MFSITDFSPLSTIPRDHILVVHKGYFDGGNQADSSEYDIVTLAAYSGSAIQWKNFDAKWNAVLQKHGAPWLHTTDAIGLTKEFSKRHGWTEAKVTALLEDCVSVIATCSAFRNEHIITRNGLRGATVSILLKDFKRVASAIPDLATADHILATQCAAFVLHFGIHMNPGENLKFQLFFDRNEPFMGHIQDRVNNRQAKKYDPIWKNVYSVTEVDMRNVPGLQASDLLGWAINHNYEEQGTRGEWQDRLLAIDRDKEWLDYPKLIKPQAEKVKAIKEMKLPKRKPTR